MKTMRYFFLLCSLISSMVVASEKNDGEESPQGSPEVQLIFHRTFAEGAVQQRSPLFNTNPRQPRGAWLSPVRNTLKRSQSAHSYFARKRK